MRKLTKAENKFENMLKAIDMAKEALRNGLGPAHNSDKTFGTIDGKIEKEVYYVIIMERGENGNRSKPVDYYAWSPKSNFVSGFGGYYNEDYDTFIRANHWVEDELSFFRK